MVVTCFKVSPAMTKMLFFILVFARLSLHIQPLSKKTIWPSRKMKSLSVKETLFTYRHPTSAICFWFLRLPQQIIQLQKVGFQGQSWGNTDLLLRTLVQF